MAGPIDPRRLVELDCLQRRDGHRGDAPLEDLGRTVPDDVAVIGVDDITLSALVRPALTTVRIDRQLMGARAVDMLMQMSAAPDAAPRRETVDVSLVHRDSA